jgi:hypothetical protein
MTVPQEIAALRNFVSVYVGSGVKTGGYRTATLMTGSPSINGHTGRFLTALPTDGAFSRYAARPRRREA